jgi:hypothetical protein
MNYILDVKLWVRNRSKSGTNSAFLTPSSVSYASRRKFWTSLARCDVNILKRSWKNASRFFPFNILKNNIHVTNFDASDRGCILWCFCAQSCNLVPCFFLNCADIFGNIESEVVVCSILCNVEADFTGLRVFFGGGGDKSRFGVPVIG